ncbi:MAG: MFS transporter [Rhodospirillaceae bacterium]|nr:MFS transporter [Rhodospirillaceae bacterium]
MLSFFLKYLAPYFQRKLVTILILGFVSGLPLLLSFGTLSAWLREAGVERSTIGLFALVGLPYALKPIWAPLMDGLRLPFLTDLLGRRRAWLIASQVMLASAIIGLAYSDPKQAPVAMAVFAVLVAFFSASQDIVIDAYRIETLPDEQQGMGAAMVTYGYRGGMLVAGAGTLFLADYWTWTHAYLVMSLLICIGMLIVILSPEPEAALTPDLKNRSLRDWLMYYVVNPFSEFATRPGWILIILFVVTFKLGDAFLSVMTNPFYIDLGFSKTEIAEITKLFGVLALGIGLFIGGILIKRFGMLITLVITGILQAASNLIFAYQAIVGYDLTALTLTIAVENITGGMGTAAFVAYLSGLTNISFTATQYALLSALMSLGRNILSSPSGYVVDALGWVDFFVFSVVMALPGLFLLLILVRWFPDHMGRK